MTPNLRRESIWDQESICTCFVVHCKTAQDATSWLSSHGTAGTSDGTSAYRRASWLDSQYCRSHLLVRVEIAKLSVTLRLLHPQVTNTGLTIRKWRFCQLRRFVDPHRIFYLCMVLRYTCLLATKRSPCVSPRWSHLGTGLVSLQQVCYANPN